MSAESCNFSPQSRRGDKIPASKVRRCSGAYTASIRHRSAPSTRKPHACSGFGKPRRTGGRRGSRGQAEGCQHRAFRGFCQVMEGDNIGDGFFVAVIVTDDKL
jgi:hypothetical protein